MHNKTCEHCNKEYETRSSISIYCSVSCKNKAWKKKRSFAVKPPCAWCGNPITELRFTKFCCNEHQLLAERDAAKQRRREESSKLCCELCGAGLSKNQRKFCSNKHKEIFHLNLRAAEAKLRRNKANEWCLMCGESLRDLPSAYRKFCCESHQLTWKKLKDSNRPIIVRLDHRTVVETKNYYGVAKIKQDWLAKKNAPYLKASEKQQAEEQTDPKDLLHTDII